MHMKKTWCAQRAGLRTSRPRARRRAVLPTCCRSHAGLAVVMVILLAADTCIANVSAWTRWEHPLTSATDYVNPYQQVNLTVTYVAPSGATFKCGGYWDGGRAFKIRFMFPAPGTWAWRTTCSDAGDKGLHGQSGTVEVEAYAGGNPLFAKGYPTVSANQRYLTYGNGEPFLWIGDTPWAAFIAASAEEWESYLRHRQENKFTIIQAHCGGAWQWIDKRKTDRLGNAPFAGNGETLQWNPAYWQEVDRKVQAANERGLIMYICAVRQPGPGFPENDAEQVARFARHLAARMMGSFVVFSPVADDVWSPLADVAGHAIDGATPLHLISAHPRFFLEPAITFHGKDYVDIVGVQPGCGWTYDPYKKEKATPFSPALAAQYNIEWPLALWRLRPTKPVINQEGHYDGAHNQKPVKLARSTGYWSFLSGAPGFTYGCVGVWNWGVSPRGKTTPIHLPTVIRRPSATYMKYLHEFFAAIPWWTLEPAPELVRNPAADWLKRIVAARSQTGDLAAAYLPDNAEAVIDLKDFPAAMQARWHNPTTGECVQIPGTVPVGKPHAFLRPAGWEDALLVLTRASAK